MTGIARQWPRYQSHKQVCALKIKALEYTKDGGLYITPEEDGYAPFLVDVKYVPKNEPTRPQVGWYFVLYQDGYQSFSPADPFESGYTRI